jgi:signal transduction histidine kinase
MKNSTRVKTRGCIEALFLMVFIGGVLQPLVAQDKLSVQIKTFTPQLEPYRNIEVSINGEPFIVVGNKGSVVADLSPNDFPIKSVTIKNETLEAASWLFSKGVVEIIVRNKSYQMTNVVLRGANNSAIAGAKITFIGKKILEATSDANGKFSIPLAVDEQITSVAQFRLAGFTIKSIAQNNGETVVNVEPLAIASEEPLLQQTPPDVAKGKDYFEDFNVGMLDSIQSLTMFYAIFKDYQINELSKEAKQRIDAKFNQLVKALQDSVKQADVSFMGKINDSTLVREDLANLVNQARQESEMLTNQRDAFDEKIRVITKKLGTGISSMDEDTRAALLSELSLLERLLLENESRFFKNQNDYRRIINAIKENYFNIKVLEEKLSESEAQRLEEKKVFQQRLLAISAIVLVFAVLIILLFIVRKKLKRQTMELARANKEINHINENLEHLVYQRTRLLAEAHKELDTFLYRASHDMRSPVRSIMGLCNIATQLVEGEAKELIHRVIATTMGMDKLLKKLSIISEINQPTDFAAIRLRETIEEVRRDLSAAIPAQSGFILNCSSDIVIYSYRNLIHTILQNVIENGLIYGSLDNTKQPELQVDVEATDQNISITIIDNGIGFERSVKDKLFDMFFKGTEKSQGHGLGLYIVSKAIQALDGNIDVHSQQGVYTKFQILLPIHSHPVNTNLLEQKAVA